MKFSELHENQNYISMFNDFIAGDVGNKELIGKYISWAKSTLKKSYRIVWFLRWVRVELAGRNKHLDTDTELSKLNKKLKTSYTRNDLIPISNLMTNLNHFLGLHLTKIDNVIWDRQSPQDLLSEFKQTEDQWKTTVNRSIKYDIGKEPKKILQCKDDYAWFDLEKSYCDIEAKSMGHCGNAGGLGTILSLRKLIHTDKNQTHWYPVATFILHDNGLLGEMKGRGNDKPSKKYHPYIIELLKHDIIKGIVGGGYKPQNNFNINDLEDKEKLLKAKPELGTIEYVYNKYGMTPEVLSRINIGLAQKDLPSVSYDRKNKRFILHRWSNFERFVYLFDDLEKILKIATKSEHLEDVRSYFISMASILPKKWQDEMISRAGIRNNNVEQAAKILMYNDDEWYKQFYNLYNISDDAWNRLLDYVNAGFDFFILDSYLNIPTELQEFKNFVDSGTQVCLYVSELNFIQFAENFDDEEDDYDYEIQEIINRVRDNNGWDYMDSEANDAMWFDAGLIDSKDRDIWLKENGYTEDNEDLVLKFIDVLRGNKHHARIDDPRQRELKLKRD